MAKDLLTSLAGFLADLGHETAQTLGDPEGRNALLARAGLPPPPGNPAANPAAANALDQIRTKADDPQGGKDPLALLVELSDAMIVLLSLVQEAANVHDEDDAWNLLATCLDVIALDRLRRRIPEALAVLQAFHLISNDRLLIGELIKSKDQWGSFLLGHPADDEAKADNWSIILGALLVFIGRTLPLLDNAGKAWRTDLLFGWDPEPNPDQPLITHALQRMATIRLTHRSGVVEENVGLSVVVVPPADGGWGMLFGLDLGAGLTFPVREHLELLLQADSPDAIEAFIGDPSFVTTGLGHTTAKLELRRKQEAAENLTIGGDDALHLEIGTFSTGFVFADPVRFRFAIGGGALVIPQKALGKFIGSVLPSSGAKFDFDVDLMVDSKGKVSFAGGAGLTVTIPVNASLAVLKVRSVTIALMIEGSNDGVAATLGAVVAFGIEFGSAFKVIVDGIGAKLAWTLPSSAEAAPGTPPVHGNLGPAGNLNIDFVPPKGIGILIDVGPIKGGGFFFFDPPHRTYAGVLEAALALCGKGIQIKAAGLLRETDDGWDFVLIVSAQFEPGIELFLGLTLNGVGGMLGINVAVDVNKLRAGLHDGAVGRLLFPDDPVANAPGIIATMVAVFPHRQGGMVAGPMLQLGWGRPKSFVTISVAIIVALPSPALLAIMGRLQIVAPDESLAIMNIKVDFLGIISFEEPSFSFDASLVDSRAAAFPITGDMAMRAGAQGFILSVGGVHPRFTPPANLPQLKRIAIDISPNPFTKIRAEAYLAVTSNTFQIGLHASLAIDAGPASVHGWLDFDALVQWEPRFRFSIHMDIGLELRVGGRSIAGVSVDLLLEGPSPWHAKGQAELHFLFFTVHAGFEVTWGELDAGSTPPEIDASARVAEGLSAPGAWAAVAPAGDALVTFRNTNRPDIGVHPYGQLSARQQAVPIGVPITRIGRSHVAGGTATVTLTPIAGAPPSSAAMGQFAASQFVDLADDEKLSRPSFESFQDGIIFGSTATVTSSEQISTAKYETVFIPDIPRPGPRTRLPLGLILLAHSLEVGAIARAGLHYATLHDGPDQRVTVAEPSFRVVAADTLTAAPDIAGPFASATAAYAAVANAGGRLLVVDAHEVAA